MKTVYHAANTRGHANHGWLNTHHTFSFASYMEPTRMHFGMLRVLNDDIIQGGTGFGTHPHQDMEIISIPLEGGLAHKDSMHNDGIIKTGEVQVMSAGTGVQHSEFNPSESDQANFLQIWVFPKEKGIAPRYDQKEFATAERENQWQTLVSPEEDGTLTIHQDATFKRTALKAGQELEYTMSKPNHGVYFFMIDGEGNIAGQAMQKRDGLGVYEAEKVAVTASQDADILALEVPMN